MNILLPKDRCGSTGRAAFTLVLNWCSIAALLGRKHKSQRGDFCADDVRRVATVSRLGNVVWERTFGTGWNQLK